jgi:hypothetical protein
MSESEKVARLLADHAAQPCGAWICPVDIERTMLALLDLNGALDTVLDDHDRSDLPSCADMDRDRIEEARDLIVRLYRLLGDLLPDVSVLRDELHSNPEARELFLRADQTALRFEARAASESRAHSTWRRTLNEATPLNGGATWA